MKASASQKRNGLIGAGTDWTNKVGAQLNGKNFRISIRTRCRGDDFCLYDKDEGELKFFLHDEFVGSGRISKWDGHSFRQDDITGYKITETSLDQGSFLGENVFGAHATVSRTRVTTWSIGHLVKSSVSPTLDPVPQPISIDAIEQTIKIDPTHRKTLISQLRLQIEGHVSADSHGSTITCTEGLRSATFDAPYETHSVDCTLISVIDHISISRADTGEVFAEWRRDLPTTGLNSTSTPR
jgi:hypothetical protein